EYATLQVRRNGKDYLTLHPAKRLYLARGDTQTEADIRVGFFRALFTALGDQRSVDPWVLRIHYRTFVFWIWFGAFLMALGGVWAVLDKRYRRVRVHETDETQQEPVTAPAGASA